MKDTLWVLIVNRINEAFRKKMSVLRRDLCAIGNANLCSVFTVSAYCAILMKAGYITRICLGMYQPVKEIPFGLDSKSCRIKAYGKDTFGRLSAASQFVITPDGKRHVFDGGLGRKKFVDMEPRPSILLDSRKNLIKILTEHYLLCHRLKIGFIKEVENVITIIKENDESGESKIAPL